jgi:hypothetical protein
MRRFAREVASRFIPAGATKVADRTPACRLARLCTGLAIIDLAPIAWQACPRKQDTALPSRLHCPIYQDSKTEGTKPKCMIFRFPMPSQAAAKSAAGAGFIVGAPW